MPLSSYFKVFEGKTVVVTGHTGFKGSWLTMWLNLLGAKVIGVSNNYKTDPQNFNVCNLNKLTESHEVDIRDFVKLRELIRKEEPDFIFHLAAQALVRTSHEMPLATFETNAMGSANILNSILDIDKRIVCVMITSDKVYFNKEWVWGYKETDRLGGRDPYSASKAMAEVAIESMINSYFNNSLNTKHIGIARAGNVIGGGDWARDRIIPDCVRAWSSNKLPTIRNPFSTRPWQHVLEPISGYLVLAENLFFSNDHHGEAFNFGPASEQIHTVLDLLLEMKKNWENVKWKDLQKVEDKIYEAGLLKLNCDKALSQLAWKSTLNFKETVDFTVSWYKTYYSDPRSSMHEFSMDQIEKYAELAKSRGVIWASNSVK